MKPVRSLVPVILIALSVQLTGCYTTQITVSDREPSGVVATKWAHSWIGGLVPATPWDARSECRSGVSVVSTKLSFANMLVGAITGGIYTPMTLEVRCAR